MNAVPENVTEYIGGNIGTSIINVLRFTLPNQEIGFNRIVAWSFSNHKQLTIWFRLFRVYHFKQPRVANRETVSTTVTDIFLISKDKTTAEVRTHAETAIPTYF